MNPPLLRTMMFTAALAAVALPVQAAEPLFDAPWRAFDVGDFPTFAPVAMAVGDVDGDGIRDIVAAREYFGGPGLSVLFGVDGGTFESEVIYELDFGQDLGDVALQDIDGDDDPDAIASVPGNAGTDSRIVLWRNNGDGSFAAPEFFPAGEGPVGIAVADFTGDGHPDIITADNGYVAGSNDTMSLLAHNGETGAEAGFLPPVSFTTGDDSLRVAAGDLDADGDLDVVIGRAKSSGLSVLFNDGAGGFGAPTHYEQLPGGDSASPAVALADMDNDGDLDLLGAGATNGTPSYGVVSIRLNDGSGVFGVPALYNLDPWTFTPHTIATADINDDGWRDVLVSTPSGRANDGFNVMLSDGVGGFLPVVRYEAAKQTFDLATWDVDEDGNLDVTTVANDSSVVTVHLNQGDGTFPILRRYDLGFITRDMVEGDFDRDGDVDLVAGGDDDVWLLHNNGDATFPPALHMDTPFAPGDILLADMNNDGWLDLVLRAYDFAVALNDMKGGFEPVVVTPVGSSQSGEIGVFDLDNDGDLDVVCTDPGPASRVYLFRNNGNGTSYTFMNIIADFDGLPFGVGGGDLDHDGNVDLLFDNALGITVYPGNGDFTVGGPIPTPDYGYPFVLQDINGDGEFDLSYKRPEPSFGTTEVATMLGYGDLGFAFPTILPGPNGREGAFRVTSDVDVADVTADGIPDVLFTNNAPNDVSVFPGIGDGGLLPQDRYGAGYAASDSAIADLDGDGLNDVAVVISLPPSGLYDAVVILRNVQSQAEPGDVNGDGVVDTADLLALLAAWGTCPDPPADCPADFDGDGTVGTADLLILLANWT
jgi:hypothetical protein